MRRIELFEVLDEVDEGGSVNDEGKGSQSRGGGVKLYPPGERCRTFNCPNRLTQTNPLDICVRCQDRGLRGNPRKPIDKNKKGQKEGER